MSLNLLFAAGLACALTGALLVVSSFTGWRGTRRSADPVYPRFLAKRSVKRLDRRLGIGFVVAGGLAIVAARYGYSAPLSLWRYPAVAAAAVLAVHAVLRFLAQRPVRRPADSAARRGLFESRRSLVLRVAAEREASALLARELRNAPRDCGVVYLRRHWERRWWSDRLGVSADAIDAAIGKVGPMSHDVRRYLAAAA